MGQKTVSLSRRADQKRQKLYRILIASLVTLILLGSIGFIFKKQIGLFLFDSIAADDIKPVLDKSYEPIGTEPVEEAEISSDPFSILLLGVDPRGNERGRSDSMIYSVIRPDDNKVLLVSIPRDSYVDIIGYVNDKGEETELATKVNAAYSYGGAKMSIDTVEHLLQNKINYYATINFNGLKDIVDAIGGVKLPITKLIENKDPNHEKLRVEPNKPIYDGQEALSYVRYREDSDENRTMRQRIFLSVVMDEMFTFKSLSKIPELIEIAGANFTTNMTSDFMISKAKEFFLKDSYPTLSNYMLHGEGFRDTNRTWYSRINEADLTYTQELIANWLDPNTLENQLMDPELKKVEGEDDQT